MKLTGRDLDDAVGLVKQEVEATNRTATPGPVQIVVSKIYNTLNDVLNRIRQLPKGRSDDVYTVPDEASLQALYEELTSCSQALTGTSYPGTRRVLGDGTIVGLRNTSTSGGSTIDVFVNNQIRVKVHIE